MKILLKISLIVLSFLFILAGFNHFRNPEPYLSLIPPYVPYPQLMNYLSGIVEIILGATLLFNYSRKTAAWGIIILMIAFVPAHIYMIQKAPFMMGTTLITPAIAWIRLPLQALLILWAYIHTKNRA
jgi:uncharacterized membrane protein